MIPENINLLILQRFFVTVVVLFSSTFHVLSQVKDNFTDGDINTDPTWITSTFSGLGSDFITNDSVLQSNGPAEAASIWISTDGLQDFAQNLVEWTFKVKYDFAPSASNRVWVYLVSDQQDLTTATQGYYLRMGKSGSSDGIDLYKTGSTSPVISDTSATVALKINTTIRVIRDLSGDWTLEADTIGNSTFFTIGSAHDNEFVSGSFFGFVVNHTSTRNQSFFFDDIDITLKDISAPSLQELKVTSEKEISLKFSEELEEKSALVRDNYSVNNGIGTPSSVSYEDGEKKTVHLVFEHNFPNAIQNEIRIQGLMDLNGNMTSEVHHEFLYFQEVRAITKDVIFTEIMADPEPPNDLPPIEYVEVYNQSDKIFDLEGWLFSDAATPGVLPHQFLFPKEFLILCPQDRVDELADYGNVVGLNPWPTLNNGQDVLILKDNYDLLLDSLSYKSSWYGSSSKTEGGWSLELIDPANLCGEEDNWAASEDLSGGTPGAQNSVLSDKPDLRGPEIVEAYGIINLVTLEFNEKLDKERALIANYSIDHNIEIDTIIISNDLRKVELQLATELQRAVKYTVTVNNVTDCNGNTIDASHNNAEFALIENAFPHDIVINEILFNPRPGGVDFVEIYNRSEKHINLSHWTLSRYDYDNTGSRILSDKQSVDNDIILIPGQYLVLTEDPTIIKEQYPKARKENIIALAGFPRFPNDRGSVVIISPDSVIVDLLDYKESYHFDFIDDAEGVSLERISINDPTNNRENWKSAATTEGYATPGYINSQAISRNTGFNDHLNIEPKIIIPDGSGHDDFAVINYSFEHSGYIANVKILDMYGRIINDIAKNEAIPVNGFYTWDGTDNLGEKVRIGYYIVYFEVFDIQGDTRNYKEKIVVGTRF